MVQFPCMKSGPNKQLTQRSKLRDVAREAGVSVATVSRVINNSPRVTKATKLKIEKVISRLEFTPDPVARALTIGRTKTVGAVIPTLDHAIFSNFLNSLEEGLAAVGYALVVATTDGDPDIEASRTRALLEMGVEGVVLSGMVHRPETDQLANRYGAPVILTSCYSTSAVYPTIGYDNSGLARLAMRHLHDLDHKDIQIVHGPLKNNDRTQARLAGAQAFASEFNIRLTSVEVELSEAGGVEAVKRLIQLTRKPTALLCLSDVIALGSIFELQRTSLRTPQDISVMGFDNLDWSVHSEPPLTSISLPVRQMGQQTAEAIFGKLEHDIEIKPQLIEGSLITRASTARAI